MIAVPISKLEKKLTYLIASNGKLPRLDRFMIMISDPYEWLLLTIVLAMSLIYTDWKTGLIALLLGGLASAITDGINTRIIKIVTDRIRPGKQYHDIKSLGAMNSGKKSFPSNHASNTMAFAVAFSLFFPVLTWFMVPLSLLVGYSRIYCGAHFPLDVIAGWLHGAIWTILIYSLLNLPALLQ